MAEFLGTILVIVTTLFPIVNPLGGAPIFLALTRDASRPQRRTLSWGVARNSFFLLLGSILIGSHVLSFFGVSLPIVQVGGGLVVIAAGWALLKSEDPEDRKEIGRTAGAGLLRKAFYPLTLPLTVGPGSIATAITLGANAPHPGGGRLLFGLVAAIIAALVLSLSVFLCYAFSDRTVTFLGPTGTTVIMRLSAFLLVCIGLQILWNGVAALVRTL